MRKAPAPGAEVAAVVGRPTHPPTRPVPDRGRCRKDARECACCYTHVTAVLLGPHCRAPPPSGSDSRLPRALMPRGNLGRTGRAVKSPCAYTDGGHGRTPVPLFTGRGAKRPSGQRGAEPETARPDRATGLQEHQAARGDCVEDPPREIRRAWNGPTPKGGRVYEHHPAGGACRGAECPAVRRPDEPYGPADQRGRDARCERGREPRASQRVRRRPPPGALSCLPMRRPDGPRRAESPPAMTGHSVAPTGRVSRNRAAAG